MQHEKFLHFFWLNKLLMQSCGILPISTQSLINNFIIFLSYTAASFLLLPAFYSLLFHWDEVNTMEKSNIFSEQLQVTVTMIKATTLIVKRRKIIKLVEGCNDIRKLTENPELYKKIFVFIEIAKYLTIGYTINILSALAAMYILPILANSALEINGNMSRNKQLPFSMGIFRANSQNFNILYGLQLPTSFLSIITIIATDTSIAFFTLHGCAYARLCQVNYSRSSGTPTHNDTGKVRFRNTIKIHQKFLEYSENVKDVFNVMMLVQLLISITAMCGFSITFLIQKDARLKALLQVIACILQLWLYCWPSQILESESAAIAHSVFDLPWYEWPKKHKKLVEIIIVRSQISTTLTAGKFFPVSLTTFTAIISKAASVFTVFRQII